MSDRWQLGAAVAIALAFVAGLIVGQSVDATAPPPLEPVPSWLPVETGTPPPLGREAVSSPSLEAELDGGVPVWSPPAAPPSPSPTVGASVPGSKAAPRAGPSAGTRQPAESVPREPTPAMTGAATGWRKAIASFYGPGFYGNRTACGQAYTTTIIGVAHRTLRCGTLLDFRNPANGRVQRRVPVIDRGPYVAGRLWDLSGGLCTKLGHCYTGVIDWRYSGG